ncbi:hypothetical protein [Mycobacterium sp. SMC-4]|uniref:hypothetical protein n=1 Tax=Mycobacterium sp. SMC-4 TaxID=2857059 RepID=UPI0021B4BF97|nr:hypothetical protein [Mycobacterium sp. SMC-4]UXA18254.1 hypothetical protein KXD98_00495 [Mycobacterium sp. SMC-4]
MKGLRFRETMTGLIDLRSADPVAGYASATAVAVSLHARVDIDDVADFVGADRHCASLRVELVIPVLGGHFLSRDGQFSCFERGAGHNGRPVQQMVYTAVIFNNDRVYRMFARKILEPGWPWRLWRDTTTLHLALVDETPPSPQDPESARPRGAAGVVRLSPSGFLAQLTTMRAHGDVGFLDTPRLVFSYARFFLAGLAKTYLLRARW